MSELLVSRGLTKRFGGVQALGDVDVVVRRGETIGMIGPNGSGKTSFVNAITGHLPLDSGTIGFAGRDITGAKPHRIVEAGIVRTYQQVRVFSRLTVRRNLDMAHLMHSASRSPARDEEGALLDWLTIGHRLDAPAGGLTLFEQRRLELAMRLLLKPQMILLDEPVGGLAPAEVRGMMALLGELKVRCNVFVIEHTMKVIRELADRVVVLITGQKIADGAPGDILKDKRVIEYYLGRAVLEVEGLVVRYGAFLALQGVDIHVNAGEIVGVIGANGAGKSSMVRAVGGLLVPAAGRVVYRGSVVTGPAHERIELGLSIVPEGRGLFPQMSVEENLMMGGFRFPRANHRQQLAERCYAMFPVLRDRRRQIAGTLSGGQQQMLAISVGLMAEPETLILDEPSLGLAPIVLDEIGQSFATMKAAGVTIVLVEQNATLTASVADRIYVLQNGRVRFHDTPKVLFSHPEVAESFLSVA